MSNNSALSIDAAKNCPPEIKPSNSLSENIQNERGFLSSLGLNQCKTNQFASATSLTTSSGDGPFNVWANNSKKLTNNTTDNSTVGCGALNLLMQNHIDTVNKVSCLIQENETEVSYDVSSINSITFLGNVYMECDSSGVTGGLTINQTNVINMKIITSIGTTMSNKIKQAVSDGVSNFANDLKNSGGTAYGPEGQGTQNINVINGQSVQNAISDGVDSAIADIKTNIVAGNTLTIGSTGSSIYVKAAQCTINQNSHISLVANNIVNTAFQNALDQANLQQLMPVPPAPPMPPSASSSNLTLYIIIGIVVLLVLGIGCYFYFKKSKPSIKQLPSKPLSQLPNKKSWWKSII